VPGPLLTEEMIAEWERVSGCSPTQALLERFVQAGADIAGQGLRLGVAEDLDGFFGRVHHQAAIFAMLQVAFQVRPGARVELTVQVV